MHCWFVYISNQVGNEHYWKQLRQVWLGLVSMTIGASVADDHSFFCWKNEPGFLPGRIQAIIVYVVKAQPQYTPFVCEQ